VIPWEEIDRAFVPGQEGDMILRRRGDEYSIRTAGIELMNSRVHGSEEALATMALDKIQKKSRLKILIGGLGLGYTLAAALAHAASDSQITVSELIPAVVRWNREYLGHLAGHPLKDPRVVVAKKDVGQIIQERKAAWDVILLDVDNGPEGLTLKSNDRLYTGQGLGVFFWALKRGGVLAVWSSAADDGFTRRLNRCGFSAEAASARARNMLKGSRHTIWLAVKPGK
jgi:spermidine synthase